MERKVSVVIPTFRRTGEKITRAIQSVLNQTYKNTEIIVIDDNGEDEYSKEIQKILVSYPSVKYIAHEVNKGACAARNTGILNASGEFIAFLDDDDTWIANKLERQIEKILSPRVGLVYCGIRYYYEKSDKVIYKYAIESNQPCKDLLINNYIGSTSCGLVRKSTAINVGLFDINLRSGQDLDFWYRIAENYEIACVNECLVNYTIYNENTITSNYQNRLLSNLYLKKKYLKKINADKELSTVYNLKIAKAYLKLNKYLDSARFFLKSLFKNEISIKYLFKYFKASLANAM